MDNQATRYGIPEFSLTDTDPHLVSKLSSSMWLYPSAKPLTTKAYQHQKSGQKKKYKKKIATQLFHYVNEHRDIRDTFVIPLTYAYRSQVKYSTS